MDRPVRGTRLEVELEGVKTEGAVLIYQMKSLDFENRGIELIEKAQPATGSAASRERLANAVTDRLLDHHAQGKDVNKLIQLVAPKIGKDPGLPGLGR